MRKLARFFSSVCIFIFKIVPDELSRWISLFLSFIWVDVLSLRKKVVYDNIEIAFPGTNENIKYLWMKKSIFVLAKNLFDLFKVPHVNQKWIDAHVVIHGRENIDLYQDQGVFFLTLHMASGDLAAAVVSESVKPLSLISKRFSNPFMDEFWFYIRQKSKTRFIDAHSKQNSFEILKALKEGRGVVFVLDQFMGKPYGIESLFFGKQTGTAYGLALLTQKTKKPVIPLYSYWGEDHRLHIQFRPAIDLSEFVGDDRDRVNARVTNRFNEEIESIIKEHPEQWMWVHKRWKVFE